MFNVYVDALAGQSWASFGYGNRITYYFDNDGSRAWTAAEKTGFTSALQSWANVANITIEQVTSPYVALFDEFLATTADMDYFFGSGSQGVHDSPSVFGAALGVFASDGNKKNPYVLGYGKPLPGTSSYEVLVHEIGHGLGLAHPHDDAMGTGVFPGLAPDGFGGYDPFSLGDGALNQDVYTVMSYNEFNKPGPATGHVVAPMAFDIAAIQKLYGANTSYHAGDNVYNLGDMIAGGKTTPHWECIWDAGGNDTISYSGTRAVAIDLRAATLEAGEGAGGYLSQIIGSAGKGQSGGYTIANGAVIENATGGGGKDVLTGNDAANVLDGRAGNDKILGGGGNDRLTGGAGNDLLNGGTGADTMAGGAGNDVFRFNSLEDSGIAATSSDLIVGFEHGRDKIDFALIDASSAAAGDQAFRFAGSAEFSGTAGELHFLFRDFASNAADLTILEADVDGDKAADLKIELAGLVKLTGSDFIL